MKNKILFFLQILFTLTSLHCSPYQSGLQSDTFGVPIVLVIKTDFIHLGTCQSFPEGPDIKLISPLYMNDQGIITPTLGEFRFTKMVTDCKSVNGKTQGDCTENENV